MAKTVTDNFQSKQKISVPAGQRESCLVIFGSASRIHSALLTQARCKKRIAFFDLNYFSLVLHRKHMWRNQHPRKNISNICDFSKIKPERN